MPEYVVSWTIDIDAESPREAAREALRIQRNPDSIATVFCVAEVIDRRGVTTSIVGPTVEIDLDDDSMDEIDASGRDCDGRRDDGPDFTEQARELGRQAGRAAGSWAADGNTSAEHIRKVLAMLDDGDPQAHDFLPREPNLSGEFADDPTPQTIAVEVLGDLLSATHEDVDALGDAWEDGVRETFEPECERTLRGFLPDDDGAVEGESA